MRAILIGAAIVIFVFAGMVWVQAMMMGKFNSILWMLLFMVMSGLFLMATQN